MPPRLRAQIEREHPGEHAAGLVEAAHLDQQPAVLVVEILRCPECGVDRESATIGGERWLVLVERVERGREVDERRRVQRVLGGEPGEDVTRIPHAAGSQIVVAVREHRGSVIRIGREQRLVHHRGRVPVPLPRRGLRAKTHPLAVGEAVGLGERALKVRFTPGGSLFQ